MPPLSRRPVNIIALILAATLTIPGGLLPAAPASAHGASIVQADGDYGPYHVVIVTGSPTPDPRDVLLTLVLTSKAGDNVDELPGPVLDASVQATFEASGKSAPPAAFAIPPEPRLADQGYYERTLTLPTDDDWQAKVDVDGPPGKASVTFAISTGLLSNWSAWLEWTPLVAVVTFAVFMLFARRRAQAPSQNRTDLPPNTP
jgi:hypothetical protein